MISEVKMAKLTASQREALGKSVLDKFLISKLVHGFKAEIEVIDLVKGLGALAGRGE